ncbi:hypothetical protein HGRIS_013708 [Hohenbuehelia grisea]|uniref:Terpene synthase n=1 Tax=Hohenbuehelia grisea TaxID=104357 RepID=A0ABR3IWF1_9AGAR
MPSKAAQFTLPDTLSRWPWQRHLNPHYEKIKMESDSWVEGFGLLEPAPQMAFNACNFIASLFYPKIDGPMLRFACDLMQLFFIYEEFSDSAGEQDAKKLAEDVMNAMRNSAAQPPVDEHVVAQMARELWLSIPDGVNETPKQRFLDTFDAYVSAVTQEAYDRSIHLVRDVQAYLELRRLTIGIYPSIALLEFVLDLPEEVLEHKAIEEQRALAIDMILICNDICSYNVEQSKGEASHNFIVILMRELQVDIAGAMDWLSAHHKTLVDRFLVQMASLPSLGADLDQRVQQYVNGLGDIVRGNDCWSFESERYFGKHGREIQKHRVVTLSPAIADVS